MNKYSRTPFFHKYLTYIKRKKQNRLQLLSICDLSNRIFKKLTMRRTIDSSAYSESICFCLFNYLSGALVLLLTYSFSVFGSVSIFCLHIAQLIIQRHQHSTSTLNKSNLRLITCQNKLLNNTSNKRRLYFNKRTLIFTQGHKNWASCET